MGFAGDGPPCRGEPRKMISRAAIVVEAVVVLYCFSTMRKMSSPFLHGRKKEEREGGS